MKPSLLLTFVAICMPAIALAAKAGKRPQRPAARQDGAAAEVLKTFDKNEDRQIDADELPALQKAFSVLKKLDKNSDGEIDLAEVESMKPPAANDRRSRMLAGIKQVDKNGNHKIDADEIAALQKMIAGGKVMSRLDQNGNGKLEPDEVERLNQHIERGMAGLPAAGTSSFRKPPEKPAEAAPKPETPKPVETKPEAPAPEPKPPGNFGQ